MIRRYCDVCHSEITEEVIYNLNGLSYKMELKSGIDENWLDADLCDYCRQGLVRQ